MAAGAMHGSKKAQRRVWGSGGPPVLIAVHPDLRVFLGWV